MVALRLTSPFCQCDSGGCNHAAVLAKQLGIELITIPKGQEYLDIVRNPSFGRGSGMNPCIDCRIFLLKKAKEVAEERGAKFIFTGEVVGQRPMSQHRATLMLIEREAGLEGKVIRPLSAKVLPETEAERNGWIDRKALLDISGRSRKTQIELATKDGIDFPCPAGGCLLTSKEFASKLRDFLVHTPDRLTSADVALLKVGRHFRINGTKVIIGRDHQENDRLRTLADGRFTLLEPTLVPGPLGACETEDPATIGLAASVVARYSDNNGQKVEIMVRARGEESKIMVSPAEPERVGARRIGGGPSLIIMEQCGPIQ